MPLDRPLADLTVLDLTHYVAGPYCTKLLADAGATVLKIERPGVGDGARRLGPFPGDVRHPEKSGLFLHLNTNKLGLTLDLKTATGQAIFHELLKTADAVIESFSPGTMARLGLGFPELEKINPRIVLTSISNFGQTGPYRDYLATEIAFWALSAYMYAHGEPDREPLKYPGYEAQCYAGNHGAGATMAALFGARDMGMGQQVDISILECLAGIAESAHRLMNYAYSGDVGLRPGHRREGTYPDGLYAAQDGWVSTYGPGVRNWPRLARLMERPDLQDDPIFMDPVERIYHHGDFDAIFSSWLLEHTRLEVFQRAQAQRLTFGVLYTTGDLFQDPQYRARGHFRRIEHPEAGSLTYPGAPYRMSETPWQVRRPAPRLGEHNAEILCGRLGYAKADLPRLRELGVI